MASYQKQDDITKLTTIVVTKKHHPVIPRLVLTLAFWGILVFALAIITITTVVEDVALAVGTATYNGGFLSSMFATVAEQCTKPCVPGDEDIMKPKNHGTSEYPVQYNLRWGCDRKMADNLCNFNRYYAEYSGYWQSSLFFSDAKQKIASGNNEPITFYDSGWKGSPLFTAPQNRTWKDFVRESQSHGWPSFRDSEVNWDFVRVLPSGETVSIYGTHLGHNIPDRKGNRYCINLISVAGYPNSYDTIDL